MTHIQSFVGLEALAGGLIGTISGASRASDRSTSSWASAEWELVRPYDLLRYLLVAACKAIKDILKLPLEPLIYSSYIFNFI